MPKRVDRRLVVWCPDWPVVAASITDALSSLVPVAVLDNHRVLACSETARSEGVRRGMRQRTAQGQCPELVIFDHDPARDARMFEPVVTAVESLAPGVEVVRPGVVAVPAKGPAGYFGTEAAAAERITDQVHDVAGVECQVGVAEGLFTAIVAARRGVLVSPGQSRDFLAPLRIEEIDQPAERREANRAELVDLLRRLGIRTLGEFAALPSKDVATRFGADAVVAHRAARGTIERPPGRRQPPPDLEVAESLDPPLERVDAAAFVAKSLAERLHARLSEHGLACTRLGIVARSEQDEYLHRVWRCAEPLTPAATADRVRWQLDGWISGRAGTFPPVAGVRSLTLRPEEVANAGESRLDLFHSRTQEADARAGRAFVRVQGMLGPHAVRTAILGGGRDVREQVNFVPWGEQRRPARALDQPWPGRLPLPSPSVVPGSPWPVTVTDQAGQPVAVTDRHALSAAPHRVVLEESSSEVRERAGVCGFSSTVLGWAGPWPVDQRWWNTALRRNRTERAMGSAVRSRDRMQVLLEADSDHREIALLLVHESAGWWVRGVYR